jgi:hypothetical protein
MVEWAKPFLIEIFELCTPHECIKFEAVKPNADFLSPIKTPIKNLSQGETKLTFYSEKRSSIINSTLSLNVAPDCTSSVK